MTTTSATANVVDDWKIATEIVPTFHVPRFIRLFAINRIIGQYLLNRSDIDSAVNPLRSLVAEVKDKQIHEVACTILSRLTQDGIKIYMKKWYVEKEQATVIELIFKNIILVKFGKEYQQLKTYSNDDVSGDHQQYQCQVFNNDDLMC